jgi:hypothetical protein
MLLLLHLGSRLGSSKLAPVLQQLLVGAGAQVRLLLRKPGQLQQRAWCRKLLLVLLLPRHLALLRQRRLARRARRLAARILQADSSYGSSRHRLQRQRDHLAAQAWQAGLIRLRLLLRLLRLQLRLLLRLLCCC